MTERSTIDQAISDGKGRIADVDSATRERLAARYESAWLRIESELRFVDLEIKYVRRDDWFDAEGRLTEYGEWAFRQQRLERLMTLIEGEYGRTANVALSDLSAAQRQALTIGTQTAGNMHLEGGVGPALNVDAYERIVAATDPGSPLRGVLSRYGAEGRDAIERNLIDGMIRGKGIDDIIAAIQDEIGQGVPTWKLAVVSRTESMRAFRGSLMASYDAMGVRQWQWTATLSTRTCKSCLAMHGRRFPMSQQHFPAHPACRCSPTPYVDGIAGPTGDEWFRSQPEAWQRERLGAAFDLYDSGRIDLGAFVRRQRSRTWGTAVVERSIGDVIERAA